MPGSHLFIHVNGSHKSVTEILGKMKSLLHLYGTVLWKKNENKFHENLAIVTVEHCGHFERRIVIYGDSFGQVHESPVSGFTLRKYVLVPS